MPARRTIAPTASAELATAPASAPHPPSAGPPIRVVQPVGAGASGFRGHCKYTALGLLRRRVRREGGVHTRHRACTQYDGRPTPDPVVVRVHGCQCRAQSCLDPTSWQVLRLLARIAPPGWAADIMQRLSGPSQDAFPMDPPSVQFMSKFFHPNVYRDGKVCISTLQHPIPEEHRGKVGLGWHHPELGHGFPLGFSCLGCARQPCGNNPRFSRGTDWLACPVSASGLLVTSADLSRSLTRSLSLAHARSLARSRPFV